MAGIYLHIPFCKQKCHYCDFHFSTSLVRKADMVQAIAKEIELQKEYLKGQEVSTIYFGGGTPSLLLEEELHLLLNSLHRNFSIAQNPEITLEANPDDINPASLKNMAAAGINRLSIGIQSFHEPHLQLMNRAHNATEAANCVKLAQNAGFQNISIDLIYGVPAPDHDIWMRDLQKAFSLQVQHISSYALTIEPKTAFGRWAATGKFTGGTEDFVAEQFEILLEQMQANGFEQYEISNFCRPGFYSRHNSNYWRGVPYLGLGPSAHSFS
ncbi:MAG: radical SAM family heme chaperone HemW, partial [Moraxellaceae bacterium]